MFDYSKVCFEDDKSHRDTYMDGILSMLARRKLESAAVRASFMTPEKLCGNPELYRARYIEMLGWPLNEYTHEYAPRTQKRLVGDYGFLKVYRLQIEIFENLWFGGILYEPALRKNPAPLLIVNHGGGGRPDDLIKKAADDSGVYKNVAGRCVERGAVVFAPQYEVWTDEPLVSNPATRQKLNIQFKAMGGSIGAFEIYCVRRAIDFLIGEPGIDRERIGMMGLSYGGFYTLYASAAETRIKAAYASCFFNDRFGSDERPESYREDWLWRDSALTFFDAEVSALIAPRPLYIECGKRDFLFDAATAECEYRRLKPFYDCVGAGDKLVFALAECSHEMSDGDEGIDFVLHSI